MQTKLNFIIFSRSSTDYYTYCAWRMRCTSQRPACEHGFVLPDDYQRAAHHVTYVLLLQADYMTCPAAQPTKGCSSQRTRRTSSPHCIHNSYLCHVSAHAVDEVLSVRSAAIRIDELGGALNVDATNLSTSHVCNALAGETKSSVILKLTHLAQASALPKATAVLRQLTSQYSASLVIRLKLASTYHSCG